MTVKHCYRVSFLQYIKHQLLEKSLNLYKVINMSHIDQQIFRKITDIHHGQFLDFIAIKHQKHHKYKNVVKF